MLLAIDIGNSNVVIGVYTDKWLHTWRVETDSEKPIGFYQQTLMDHLFESRIDTGQLNKVVFSSVVPGLNERFVELLNAVFNHASITILNPELYQKIGVKVARPYEIGSDLVANAVGAFKLYSKRAIIVDFGTALSFTIINEQGDILGVSIAPGLKTAIKSLSHGTAQLPEVPLEFPKSAVGENTTHAIQAGVLIGYVGLVRHSIAVIKEELGEDFLTIATGGLSSILKPLSSDFDHINKTLTLDGLRFIAN